MQLTLSMDTEHECKLEEFLSTQIYKWCISKDNANSTSMGGILLEASEMSQMSPDSCTLLLTVPSSKLRRPLNTYVYWNQLYPTWKCKVVVLGCVQMRYSVLWCYYYASYACNLVTLIDQASLVYKWFINQGSNQSKQNSIKLESKIIYVAMY